MKASLEEKRSQQGRWIGQLAKAQAQWGKATADGIQLTARVQNLRRSVEVSPNVYPYNMLLVQSISPAFAAFKGCAAWRHERPQPPCLLEENLLLVEGTAQHRRAEAITGSPSSRSTQHLTRHRSQHLS